MRNDDTEPALLAHMDQALASSQEYLQNLVNAYIQTHAESQGPETYTVVACAKALHQEVPAAILAGTLAVAIARLVQQGRL